MAVGFRLLGDVVVWPGGLAAGLAPGPFMIDKWADTVTATTGIRPSPLASGT
jgi:hypothetical protein